MKQFIILTEPCTIGFYKHIYLNLLDSGIEENNKKRINLEKSRYITSNELKRIIDNTASLRVDFGWSFENERQYKQIMNECLEKVVSKYDFSPTNLISDMRCSWIGFVPYNTFEKKIYEDLSLYALIYFNNKLVDFQNEVMQFIINHRIFLQHSILRNDLYRFEKFKKIRKNKEALVDAYHFYIEACKDVSYVSAMPRDILEEQIGCHFLYYPDLFFELLEISVLKGEIYE